MSNEYAFRSSNAGVTVTFFEDGQTFTMRSDAQNFEETRNALRLRAPADEIRVLMTEVREKIEQAIMAHPGHLRVRADRHGVYFKDEPLNHTLSRKIMDMMRQGDEITPMLHFLDRLLYNSRQEAVFNLYEFLDRNSVQFTSDGYFIAFKKVRHNYKDCYSGKIDNSIGQSPEIEPWQVDPDRDNECSNGLHVCGRSYLPNFPGERVMIVQVDPAHVVAVPRDYNCSKMRLFKYKVVGEVLDDIDALSDRAVVDPGERMDAKVRWDPRIETKEDPTRCSACAVKVYDCTCFDTCPACHGPIDDCDCN